MNYRATLANNYLVGKGIEFGALHNPLEIDRQQASVLYADKYSKSDLIESFPELRKVKESIVETNIFLNLDRDNLQALSEHNFDFYIANHVIEHLVNPLRFLDRLNRIMKPGSYLYLAAPDKEYTFDRQRKLTTWEHLYREYLENTTRLSKEHLEDFIINITKDHINDSVRKKAMYDDYANWFKQWSIRQKHRQRSIHVHVWNQDSFDKFITKAIEKLKLNLDIVDRIDSNLNKHEIIYILQKN